VSLARDCVHWDIAQSQSLLLEGDDILPSFAARWRDRIGARALFAVEEDPGMALAREKTPNRLEN